MPAAELDTAINRNNMMCRMWPVSKTLIPDTYFFPAAVRTISYKMHCGLSLIDLDCSAYSYRSGRKSSTPMKSILTGVCDALPGWHHASGIRAGGFHRTFGCPGA